LNYYSEFLNGPALKRMLGDVTGKVMLDIGCGEGCWSRWCAASGAQVTAIDSSVGLIQAALEGEARRPLGIKYIVADAAKLDMLGSTSYDVAFCFMAITDLQNCEGAISEVARLLKAGGRFATVLEHPCFTAGRSIDRKPVSGWVTRPRADGTKEFLYYWTADYLRAHSYQFEWKHDRLVSSFATTGYHRPLSDHIRILAEHRFVIRGLDEPQPLKKGVEVHPAMSKHYRIPHSLAISSVKVS
jgi:2-polyprenyl-3-methyl-5-hydroxy-6-metoxy-1,4-benzoquinol methylase